MSMVRQQQQPQQRNSQQQQQQHLQFRHPQRYHLRGAELVLRAVAAGCATSAAALSVGHARRQGRTWSPSQLGLFLKSRFAAWMETRAEIDPNDPLCAQCQDEPMQKLFKSYSDEAAQRLLAWIRQNYRQARIVDLSSLAKAAAEGSIQDKLEAAEVTRKTFESADVIYQAPLCHDYIYGVVNFLVKCGPLTGGGMRRYSFWQVTSAKTAKTSKLLQLGGYADLLDKMLGEECEKFGVVLGLEAAAKGHVQYFSARDIVQSFRKAFKDFLDFQGSCSNKGVMPDPGNVALADHARWAPLALRLLQERDDVRLLPGMTGKQRDRLKHAGLNTVADVAASSAEDITRAGLSAKTAARFVRQARLKRRSAEQGGSLRWEVLPTATAALSQLPPADDGDVFLDLEGDPLAGFQYLIGVSLRNKEYHDWWAHSVTAQTDALEGLVNFLTKRKLTHPGLHVYHYGSYDRSSLQRLACKELVGSILGTEDGEEGLLVDLLPVVRASVGISSGGYSLKQLEKIYDHDRLATVTNAADSIVAYQSWRNSPDGQTWEDSEQLRGIRNYNREDCFSLMRLETWLRSTCASGAVVGESNT